MVISLGKDQSFACRLSRRTFPSNGKTVRGAKKDEHPAPHLLSFRTHHSQETLLQVAVSEKTNEIPVAQALLPCLPVDGRIFTADLYNEIGIDPVSVTINFE